MIALSLCHWVRLPGADFVHLLHLLIRPRLHIHPLALSTSLTCSLLIIACQTCRLPKSNENTHYGTDRPTSSRERKLFEVITGKYMSAWIKQHPPRQRCMAKSQYRKTFGNEDQVDHAWRANLIPRLIKILEVLLRVYQLGYVVWTS